jgi:PAS domain S-box-containing protein
VNLQVLLCLIMITDLFSSGSFIPHGHFFLEKPAVFWVHVLFDATIALACYSVSLPLFRFVQRRRDLPLNWILLLFAAFVIICGTSHLASIWTLCHSTDWLSGSIKALTALASLSIAITLALRMPEALLIPSSDQLEIANWALQQEILDRKRVEAELIRSRDLREAFFHESADALFLVDSQTLLTLDCNRRAVELFEATDKTDLIGVEGNMLPRHQFSQTELNAILAEMQSEGFWSREIEYMTRRGNCFWGNIAAKPIVVAGQTFNLVRVTDITDRKRIEAEREQVEQALKSSEARYRAIVEDQTELIARFSPNSTILFVNGAYCRYFGLQPEDIIGKSYAPVVFEEDQESVTQAVQTMSAENPTLTIENRVVVNGEVRWTQWINRMLFDEQGQCVELQSVGRDITERKHVETERKQVEEQLQASLREKEVLLKEIHHRVKNNLQIVYSLLRLQRRQLKDKLAANALLESQSRIESIALIHEKLYQSKDLAQINLAEYVNSLVTNLFSIYNANRSQIQLKTEIEPIFLDVDKAICCGLIVNELLSNALKYAFADGNQDNPFILIRFFSEPEASTITLVIQDNGVGILGYVDFSQLQTLGLQLVQGLVSQLKATLHLSCQNGTEFRIVFPKAVS